VHVTLGVYKRVLPGLDGRVAGQFSAGCNHDPGIRLQVEILPPGEQLLLEVVGLTETGQIAGQYEIGTARKSSVVGARATKFSARSFTS
jgi:hypothetical protein